MRGHTIFALKTVKGLSCRKSNYYYCKFSNIYKNKE